MRKLKKKWHILWAHIVREGEDGDDPGFVFTDVLAACDVPNSKERVDLLRSNVCREFGGPQTEGGPLLPRFRDAVTGEPVHVRDVCKHCVKAVAKAHAGGEA